MDIVAVVTSSDHVALRVKLKVYNGDFSVELSNITSVKSLFVKIENGNKQRFRLGHILPNIAFELQNRSLSLKQWSMIMHNGRVRYLIFFQYLGTKYRYIDEWLFLCSLHLRSVLFNE